MPKVVEFIGVVVSVWKTQVKSQRLACHSKKVLALNHMLCDTFLRDHLLSGSFLQTLKDRK